MTVLYACSTMSWNWCQVQRLHRPRAVRQAVMCDALQLQSLLCPLSVTWDEVKAPTPRMQTLACSAQGCWFVPSLHPVTAAPCALPWMYCTFLHMFNPKTIRTHWQSCFIPKYLFPSPPVTSVRSYWRKQVSGPPWFAMLYRTVYLLCELHHIHAPRLCKNTAWFYKILPYLIRVCNHAGSTATQKQQKVVFFGFCQTAISGSSFR